MLENIRMNWFPKDANLVADRSAMAVLLQKLLAKLRAGFFPNVQVGLRIYQDLDD